MILIVRSCARFNLRPTQTFYHQIFQSQLDDLEPHHVLEDTDNWSGSSQFHWHMHQTTDTDN